MIHTPQQRKKLLSLARESLHTYITTHAPLPVNPSTIPTELKQKKGTFVTLTKDGNLRGCIGHIEPVQEIYRDVIDNAINAGFFDPRFPALTEEEVASVSIEVSILSLPTQISAQNPDTILQNIRPHVDGVILERDGQRATFLPQVWEELSDAETFMKHLSLKAGLSQDSWREGATVSVYQVESFSDSDD